MDVTAWIASELLDLRQRTARGIVGAVPSERWHERRVDGVPLVAVAWHTARHHDVAVNRIVCGEDEVLDAWADRVGIAHDTWRGLAEAEDLSLTATLDAAGVAGYLLDVLDHSIARLERGGVLAFDVVPDAVVERTMAWLPPGVRIVVQFMRLTPATWT